MFSNLFQSLFGSRMPTDLARSTQGRWDTWLGPISDDAPVGTDPIYDDDFLAVKDEVAKLSDIDDDLIVSTTERLLKNSAKPVFPEGAPSWYPEFSKSVYTNLHAAATGSMSVDDAIKAMAGTADKLSS